MTSKLYTQTEVIKAHPTYKRLINAAIAGLHIDLRTDDGKCTISDLVNHGIDGGFGSYIYYTDTHAFAMKHRKQIVCLLQELADDLGEEVVQTVSGFGTFRRDAMDKDDKQDLYKYIGGGKPEQGTITNLMCWFAVEEVCRWFINEG